MQVSIKTGDVIENFDSENSEITLYLNKDESYSLLGKNFVVSPKKITFIKKEIEFNLN